MGLGRGGIRENTLGVVAGLARVKAGSETVLRSGSDGDDDNDELDQAAFGDKAEAPDFAQTFAGCWWRTGVNAALNAATAQAQGFVLQRGLRLFAADPEGAHRAAVSKALEQARAEAALHAAALGMKIVRLQKISNAKLGLSASDLVSTLARVDGSGRTGRSEALAGTSFAAVTMDFLLAP